MSQIKYVVWKIAIAKAQIGEEKRGKHFSVQGGSTKFYLTCAQRCPGAQADVRNMARAASLLRRIFVSPLNNFKTRLLVKKITLKWAILITCRPETGWLMRELQRVRIQRVDKRFSQFIVSCSLLYPHYEWDAAPAKKRRQHTDWERGISKIPLAFFSLSSLTQLRHVARAPLATQLPFFYLPLGMQLCAPFYTWKIHLLTSPARWAKITCWMRLCCDSCDENNIYTFRYIWHASFHVFYARIRIVFLSLYTSSMFVTIKTWRLF